MNSNVIKRGEQISIETVDDILTRFKAITGSVEKEFWGSTGSGHSLFVGSYGRGTAIDTSDIDILVALPKEEYDRFDGYKGNGQSRLLQAVKSAIQNTFSRTNISADGQVIKVNFSDEMKFEVLPAFPIKDLTGNIIYRYPDTNMGGNWLPTDPLREQMAMKHKNVDSNGLLFDTCKHMRLIRDTNFKSYFLSGIVIDSFVYAAINDWHWIKSPNEATAEPGQYEQHLLSFYNDNIENKSVIKSPGSGQVIDLSDSKDCLKKVILKMNDK